MVKPSDLVINAFPRLQAEQKRALRKLRIRTIGDLLYHFPSRYEQSGPSATISGVAPGCPGHALRDHTQARNTQDLEESPPYRRGVARRRKRQA